MSKTRSSVAEKLARNDRVKFDQSNNPPLQQYPLPALQRTNIFSFCHLPFLCEVVKPHSAEMYLSPCNEDFKGLIALTKAQMFQPVVERCDLSVALGKYSISLFS